MTDFKVSVRRDVIQLRKVVNDFANILVIAGDAGGYVPERFPFFHIVDFGDFRRFLFVGQFRARVPADATSRGKG